MTDRPVSTDSSQSFQKNAAAAAGGDIEFYAADAGEMPQVSAEVALWGDDAVLANWLDANGIATREFDPSANELAERHSRGS